VSDVQYILTFIIMLAVGLITGQLTAGLRFQARVAGHREERAGSLYEIARDLSGAVQIDQVVRISDASIERTFRASAALLVAERRRSIGGDRAAHRDGAQRRHRHRAMGVRQGASRRDSAPTLCRAARFFTCRCARRLKRAAFLAVKARNRRLLLIPEQRQLLDTFAALIAIALERVTLCGGGARCLGADGIGALAQFIARRAVA